MYCSWMDGWMDACMDGGMDRCIDGQVYFIMFVSDTMYYSPCHHYDGNVYLRIVSIVIIVNNDIYDDHDNDTTITVAKDTYRYCMYVYIYPLFLS